MGTLFRMAALLLALASLAGCARQLTVAPPEALAAEAPAAVAAADDAVVTEGGLTVPIIPTVVPPAAIDLSALPPPGVLRIARVAFRDGAFAVLDAPYDLRNSSPADIEPTIAVFKRECEVDRAQLCVLVDQFESVGGELLAAGHYAQVGAIGGVLEAPPAEVAAWAVVDSAFRIVASGGRGAACPNRPSLSVCLYWQGEHMGSIGSGFVLLP